MVILIAGCNNDLINGDYSRGDWVVLDEYDDVGDCDDDFKYYCKKKEEDHLILMMRVIHRPPRSVERGFAVSFITTHR